jgi:hypothetical protein
MSKKALILVWTVFISVIAVGLTLARYRSVDVRNNSTEAVTGSLVVCNQSYKVGPLAPGKQETLHYWAGAASDYRLKLDGAKTNLDEKVGYIDSVIARHDRIIVTGKGVKFESHP